MFTCKDSGISGENAGERKITLLLRNHLIKCVSINNCSFQLLVDLQPHRFTMSYETVQQSFKLLFNIFSVSHDPISTSFLKLMHPNYKSYHFAFLKVIYTKFYNFLWSNSIKRKDMFWTRALSQIIFFKSMHWSWLNVIYSKRGRIVERLWAWTLGPDYLRSIY